MYTASDIAAAIMRQRDPARYRCHNWKYTPINLNRLMMLLYFCQGASLQVFDIPLFEESIEASENGPIVKSVYEKFSALPPEEDLYEHIDLLDWEHIEDKNPYVGHIIRGNIIDIIFEIDKKYTDQELLSMIQRHTPYIESLNGNKEIANTSLKNHFLKLEENRRRIANQNPDDITQEELVMYIILNKDLHMSTGKAAAQAGHVVVNYMEALYNSTQPDNNEQIAAHQHWLNNSQPKIVLQAHQKQMEQLLQLSGAFHIIDEGRTEIPVDSLTAICFRPMPRSAAPKELRRLQLYRD